MYTMVQKVQLSTIFISSCLCWKGEPPLLAYTQVLQLKMAININAHIYVKTICFQVGPEGVNDTVERKEPGKSYY